MHYPKLSIIDVETTGGSALRDRIMDIAVITIEGDKITDTFSTLINPQTHIPPFISQMTGITQDQVDNAPTFRQVADEIWSRTRDSIFVAHNVRFDYGFVKNEFRRLDKTFTSNLLCTVRLTRELVPFLGKYNLDSVMNHFGLSTQARHRAIGDTQVVAELLLVMQQKFESEKIQSSFHKLLKTPSLPAQLTEDQIKSLPEGPGVYMFYGSDNSPLYIGKSINIRERVKDHFNSDYQSMTDQQLSKLVYRIDTIPTAGELGALLLESRLIKEKMPIYNKLLRHANQLVAVTQSQNEQGYLTARCTYFTPEQFPDFSRTLGIYRSKKQAQQILIKKAEENGLCLKLLGVEKGSGPCFRYRLGTCHGACNDQENPLRYNIRFAKAFTKTKLKNWPFPGPIAVKESYEEHQSTYIIDQWCHVATLTSQDSDYQPQAPTFDYDSYRIISRYFKNNSFDDNITLLQV